MNIQAIKPVDSTAKSAAISKYSPNRDGGERGRRQQPPNSYEAKLDAQEADGFENSSPKRTQDKGGTLDFQSMLKKSLEDNAKMQELARANKECNEDSNPAYPAYSELVWAMSGSYRQIKR